MSLHCGRSGGRCGAVRGGHGQGQGTDGRQFTVCHELMHYNKRTFVIYHTRN